MTSTGSLPLIYGRDHSLTSLAIRAAQWWAPWSHVGVLDDERGNVIEARMVHGVVATPVAEYLARYTATQRVAVACPDPAAGLDWARGEIGTGYDYGAVMRFVSSVLGRDHARRHHCVELVETAVIAAHRVRFRIPPHRITVRQSYITR